MTASNSNSADSENSDLRFQDGVDTEAHGRLIVQVVQYIDEKSGPAHRLELSEEFRLMFFELDGLLEWFEDEGYVELRGTKPYEDILLTRKGRLLAGGNDD